MWKTRMRPLLIFILSLPIIWLLAGIVLYVLGNVRLANWQTIFLLRDYPVWSIVLLFTLILVYWISAHHYWKRLWEWLAGIKSLNRITQATILVSVVFYVSLIVTALLFPRLTGYTFQSDWALLLVSAIPLLALVILLLIERATSVRAKIAGVEIEFQRTITEPINQTVTLERELIAKSFTHAIGKIIQEIKDRGDSPHSLIVRVGRRNFMHIEFVALRRYVYELSRVAPIEFIVFINEDDEYLGFMPVELFKAKYPEFGIEIFLRDFQEEGYSNREGNLYRVWERVFDVPLPEFIHSWERMQKELVLPQWDPQREKSDVTEHDLSRLGVIRLYLQNPTGFQAYRQMVESKVSGIPVVDDKRRFLGIATKEKVMQEVIMQLLEKGQKAS